MPLLKQEESMPNDELRRALNRSTIVGVISILATLAGIVVTLLAML